MALSGKKEIIEYEEPVKNLETVKEEPNPIIEQPKLQNGKGKGKGKNKK